MIRFRAEGWDAHGRQSVTRVYASLRVFRRGESVAMLIREGRLESFGGRKSRVI